MKPDKIAAVAQKYHELLITEYQPIRFSEDQFAMIREYRTEKKAEYLQHACFMALEIQKFVQVGTQSKIEKANRWLGFLQCLLNITGTISGHDGAMDNAPEGVIYNRDA